MKLSNVPLVFIFILFSVPCSSCSSCSSTPDGTNPEAEKKAALPLLPADKAAPVRLVDRLEDEMILSGGFPKIPPPKTLFTLDFENPADFKPVRKVNPKNPWKVADGVLTYLKPASISPLEWQVKVKGGVLIKAGCRGMTQKLIPGPDGIGATLEIDELNSAGQVVMTHNYLKNLIGTSDWTDIRTEFRTQGRTASIMMRLMAGTPAVSGTISYDNVFVQTVSDLEALATATRYTIFPGNKAAHPAVRRINLQQDSRPAVVTRTGTKIEFPHDARLPADFHVALGRPVYSKPNVCFRISQGTETLDERCVTDLRWNDVTVPLRNKKPLVLETLARGPNDGRVGLWGNPQILSIGRSESRPVVIAVIDTLRADRLGLYGAPKNASPGIDAFASRAIVFDKAFATSSWTAPSLASMISSTWATENCAGSRIPSAKGARLPKHDKVMRN